MMAAILQIVPFILFVTALSILRHLAEQRRHDMGAGDDFLVALKDRGYRKILIGMVVTIAAAGIALWIGRAP